jgi:hypothetical protein
LTQYMDVFFFSSQNFLPPYSLRSQGTKKNHISGTFGSIFKFLIFHIFLGGEDSILVSLYTHKYKNMLKMSKISLLKAFLSFFWLLLWLFAFKIRPLGSLELYWRHSWAQKVIGHRAFSKFKKLSWLQWCFKLFVK